MDANGILNDPSMTPLSTSDGRLLITGRGYDARFIIVRSSLKTRQSALNRNRHWWLISSNDIKNGKFP